MSEPVTVGVVTYERSELFLQMLGELKHCISHYQGPVTLLVVNNSGVDANQRVDDIITESKVREVVEVKLIDSPENNISVGRNLILDRCETHLLAFIDDDEFPRVDWLSNLVAQFSAGGCDMVGGPIIPVYPPSTAEWVQSIDLHNIDGLKTGDLIRRTATGNCLLNLEVVKDTRFDLEFGLSGGGDANFFHHLTGQGMRLAWREDAIVDETIIESRATSKYAIFRFLKQGNNFARVVLKDSSAIQRLLFKVRAFGLALVGIVGGLLIYPFKPKLCARLWKGGFTNLGKIFKVPQNLYG